MSPAHDDEGDYAAEAFELDPEGSPKRRSTGNVVRREYGDEDADNDYLAGGDTEDDRAILLRQLNGSNGAPHSTKTPHYDPSDDSAAAMVSRVSCVLCRNQHAPGWVRRV